LNVAQYSEQTCRTVPKFAMVVMTGIRHLWPDMLSEQRYFDHGDLQAENGTVRFKKCKQLFEYQHLVLLRDICWSKL